MRAFAELLDRLSLTASRNAKLVLVRDYLKTTPDPDRGWALAALTGDLTFDAAKPAMIRKAVEARVDGVLFGWSYDYVGDLAETVALIWPAPSDRRPNREPELGEVIEGFTVVYANQIVREETDETGEGVEQRIPFLKAYTVFNVDQIEGLPDRYGEPDVQDVNPDERIARIDAFFRNCGADIRHGGGSAYYAPGPDHVQMPPFECFEDADAYYGTLGHEMTHWTRHPTRLDRDFGRQRFGDPGYAREELVAEFGAAFLCADLGLALEPREDHAAYIGHWLQVLKNDKRFVVSAASHAQRAVAWLHGLQG